MISTVGVVVTWQVLTANQRATNYLYQQLNNLFKKYSFTYYVHRTMRLTCVLLVGWLVVE